VSSVDGDMFFDDQSECKLIIRVILQFIFYFRVDLQFIFYFRVDLQFIFYFRVDMQFILYSGHVTCSW